MKTLVIVLCFAAITIVIAQIPQRSKSTPEEAIQAANEIWLKAIENKSVEQTVSVYDTEAVTAGSAMPPAQGIAGIRAMWANLFAQPGFNLSWKTDKVVVTKSGTIAFMTAIWRGEPNLTGPCMAVWRKQPDGQWKVLIDSAWFALAPKQIGCLIFGVKEISNLVADFHKRRKNAAKTMATDLYGNVRYMNFVIWPGDIHPIQA
jgi:ketosteroid isomerase-like protein